MTPAPTMQTRSTLLREYLSAVTCQSTATAVSDTTLPFVGRKHAS